MRRSWKALAGLSANRRGVLAIVSGTALGQASAVVLAPVLSRVYTPADFGVFTIVSGIVMTVGTVAALRFELAVPLPKKERDALALGFLGLLSALATTVIGTAVVAVAGDRIAAVFRQPALMPWLWLAPVTAGLIGVFIVLNQLAIRRRRYAAIGRRNVIQALSTVLIQIALGAAKLRPGGLLVGLGAGQAIGALSLLPGSGLRSNDARRGRSSACLKAMASRYRRFPLLLAPSGLINTAGLYVPVLLIAYFYGVQVAGWLGLTQRILALPVMLLGTAVSQVYLGELARASRGDRSAVAGLFRSATRRLSLVAGVCTVVLLIAGPWAFGLVFGPAWTQSGDYARALALSLGAQLIAVPVSMTLIVFERQWLQLSWDISRLVFTLGSVAGCHALGGSALASIWALAAASSAAYAASWLLSRATVRNGFCAAAPGPLVDRSVAAS